jgi:Uma2 family endonuclease
MGIPTVDTGLMTVDEFYAFADTRPNHEKWELIGGEPFMNAAASPIHGMIVMNIGVALANREREINAAWAVIPDLGVRVSDSDRPQPDVAVITGAPTRARDTRDVIVAFEVLSPSTRDRDFGWKQKAYTSLPSLTHYVVVSQDEIHVTVFARDDGFKPRIFRSPDDVIEFRSLGARLQLADVYRRTGL